jgi:hypothetical protein
MNERIEELFLQAGASTRTLSTIKTHTFFDPEKFAELIVRETLRVTGSTLSQHQTALRCFGIEE